jgi:hypothetical protein
MPIFLTDVQQGKEEKVCLTVAVTHWEAKLLAENVIK